MINETRTGIYILVIRLKKDCLIAAGKLPRTLFSPGNYLYEGKARNGLEGRVNRHLRKNKKLRWKERPSWI